MDNRAHPGGYRRRARGSEPDAADIAMHASTSAHTPGGVQYFETPTYPRRTTGRQVVLASAAACPPVSATQAPPRSLRGGSREAIEEYLRNYFHTQNKTPSYDERVDLANATGMQTEAIKFWYVNLPVTRSN